MNLLRNLKLKKLEFEFQTLARALREAGWPDAKLVRSWPNSGEPTGDPRYWHIDVPGEDFDGLRQIYVADIQDGDTPDPDSNSRWTWFISGKRVVPYSAALTDVGVEIAGMLEI